MQFEVITDAQEFAEKYIGKPFTQLLPQCQHFTETQYNIKTQETDMGTTQQVQMSPIIHAPICIFVQIIIHNFVTCVVLYNHHTIKTPNYANTRLVFIGTCSPSPSTNLFFLFVILTSQMLYSCNYVTYHFDIFMQHNFLEIHLHF